MLMLELRLNLITRISFTTYLNVNPNSDLLTSLTKVLAKEVAPFNIQALAVVLSTFNNNTGNAAVFSKNPLLDNYKGSVAK